MIRSKPILKRLTGGEIPVKFDRPLKLEEIPTNNKIHVINNYSPNYDYIVEEDKIYYAKKGKNHWIDISDNDKARANLYNFLGNNYDFRGYEDGEKDIWEKIKAGKFDYKTYRESKSEPIVQIPEETKQQDPNRLVVTRVPTAGGGFTNIKVPAYMIDDSKKSLFSMGTLKPEYFGLAMDIAVNTLPERYADPINNTGNWLPFAILAGGRGLENLGYRFISPLVERIAQGATNVGSKIAQGVGNLISNAGRTVGNVAPKVSKTLYSTPARKAMTNATIAATTLNASTQMVAPHLKVNNPGDLGTVWNYSLDSRFQDAWDVAANGLDRMLLKYASEDSDPISTLTIPVQTFDRESKYAFRPPSVVGDTIWNFPSGNLNKRNFYEVNKGRAYIVPEVLNASDFTFGVRNREDYNPINTEAAAITSIQTFLPYGKHETMWENYIGVDKNGNLKAGDISLFGPGDTLAGTYANDIASFMKDSNGDFVISQSKKNPALDQPAYVVWDNGKLIEKPTGQAINLLLFRGDKKGLKYGSIAGGRVLVKVGDELKLLSGSLRDIDTQFEEMKKRNNALYGTFYTLDNGSFNKGIRTKDNYISANDLKAYDNLNSSGGGNFLYIRLRVGSTPKFRSDTILTPNIRTVNSDSYKNRGKKLTNEQKGIVLHHTGTYPSIDAIVLDLTTPLGLTVPFRGTKQNREASAHVVIGTNGDRKVLATPDKVTFHAGESVHNGRENVNDFMIGIEFEGDTNLRDLTPQQIESAIEYLEPIIRKNNIRLEDIVTHQNVRDLYNDYARKAGQKEAAPKPDINLRNYNLILQALLKKIYYKK